MMAMTMDVLICTLGLDGIQRVAQMELPQLENVNYIVSWQMPGYDTAQELPESLANRGDLQVYQTDSCGLSVNRNNAIDRSTADICLIADDDLKYTPRQLQAIIDTFEENPQVQFATFMHSGGDGKWFPKESFDLSKPVKGYYVTSFEIAFRRQSVKGILRFNELFGLGPHPLQAGEENLFLHQALKKGVNCRFFPITITCHEGKTTGNRALNKGVLMASGAYIEIAYGLSGILGLPLFAWRSWRKGQTRLFPAMTHLFRGYIYGKRHFNHDGTIKTNPAKERYQ